jgi:hypothetical protein
MSAQSLEALAYGDEIRLARSRAKKAMRAHELSLEAALSLDCCQGMRISQLLEAQWNWGPARTLGLLGKLGISPLRRVGQLTERQLRVIVEAA